jgi:hypothetical protein
VTDEQRFRESMMLLSHIEILDGELWVLSALTDALSDEQTISAVVIDMTQQNDASK